MTLMMLPSDANPKGNVFGGVILKHVDLVAGIVAKRHARNTNCVTASVDRVTFLKPVYIGNALILSARLNYVHKSSMEVEVMIEAENLEDGIKVRTGTAYLTVVALDKNGRPTEVPQLASNAVASKRSRQNLEDIESSCFSRSHELVPVIFVRCENNSLEG